MPIECINLCKSFDGKPVLKDLCLTFPDNAVSCVLGPSGCGKTTLLRLLLGVLAPDSGRIDGISGRRIAAVFQEDRLIDHLTPVENIRIVLRHESPDEILDALCAVGLGDAASRPVRTLSGGMKRRTAILRALLTDAELLILDEPFKGLDAATRESVIGFMRPRLKGRTAILVTHDPAEAAMLEAGIFTLEPER